MRPRMSNPLWPVLLVLALVFFWAIGAYNRLVRLRAAVGTAFAALEPLLRERLAWVKGALPPAEPPAIGTALRSARSASARSLVVLMGELAATAATR